MLGYGRDLPTEGRKCHLLDGAGLEISLPKWKISLSAGLKLEQDDPVLDDNQLLARAATAST